MSVQSKTALNTAIDTDITTNGNNDITGAQLNSILGNMVDSYEDFIGSYTTVQIAALVGMTTRQIVYDTDRDEYRFYDGVRWVSMAHPKYEVYTALITQSGTSAPSVSILESVIQGEIVWTYNSVGSYYGTLAGLFTDNTKVFISPQIGVINTGDFSNIYSLGISTANRVELQTLVSSVNANGVLSNTAIEIRVYY